MTSAELYKIRTDPKTLFYAAAMMVGAVIPSIVLIWYQPDDAATYRDAFVVTWGALGLLLGLEFGGWLLGNEYRQGTVKRVVAAEPRRLKVFITKAAVGVATLSVLLAGSAAVGWTAARVVGSMHDVTVAWNGRELLGETVYGLTALIVVFSLSAITRSDSFAKVGTLALIMVIEPLIGQLPIIGDHTLGAALESLEGHITGGGVESITSMPITPMSVGVAVATWVAWVGVFVGTGATLFRTRDV